MLSPLESEALSLSLRVAFWSVACSLPFGVAAAWLLARRRFPGKAVVDAAIHLPLVVPPVVVGYVLLVLFARTGPIGRILDESLGVTVAFTWQGAALAAAIMGFPLMVRAIRLSFEAIDPRLEDAARTLGAGPLDVFASVTLPLLANGIIAGVVLAFARSLGEFGATIVFVASIPGETRTLPIALYGLAQMPGGEHGAMRLAVLAALLAFAAMLASSWLARRFAAGAEARR